MPQYSGIWTEQAVMQAVGAGNWPGNPGAPTIGTATAGDASASVTFTAPTDNGGSAITGYTVTSSPGGLTGTGASSPITVSGLTNGTAYTFTVRATNATGTGPASAASNSVTPAAPVYIEDVYSTYLYTGNGSTQTITNGINLSTNGGLVWTKARVTAGLGNELTDTVRGAGLRLISNTAGAQGGAGSSDTTGFTSSGFQLTFNNGLGNLTGENYVSWTFQEQPKFFDIVTYTGNGIAGRTVAHNLGSVPGFFVIKRLDASGDWRAYHRSLGANKFIYFNADLGAYTDSDIWNNTAPTATEFTLGNQNSQNINGATYVAYLFAHNAGGFGLNGTDNVISCGIAYSNSSVNLGYEPQWILDKDLSSGFNWNITDNMRGNGIQSANVLKANSTAAEVNSGTTYFLKPTATGFTVPASYATSSGFIYIAIRRGPMRVPTSGTSVFDVDAYTGNGSFNRLIDSGFTDDWFFFKNRALVNDWFSFDRLRGDGNYLAFDTTGAESGGGTDWVRFTQTQTGIVTGQAAYGDINTNGVSNVAYHFRRAPSFFDEVCYTGVGYPTALTNTHNLGVAPEMMIVKKRSATQSWFVYHAAMGNAQEMYLNQSASQQPTTFDWNSTTPSATTFTVNSSTNDSGATYVAYLFATCAGVSKVGSYTGTGATQTINCGFSAGARFVMVKRYDSTGNWYVWDTARGMVSGTDPSLLLDSTAAEVNANSVYTTAVGFQIVSTAAGINASGGTYIYLAIA